jgi:uncharacterized membrane protein
VAANVRQRAAVVRLTGETGGPTVAPSPRFERLDALRGVAIVWMALFHFCFDLSHFKFIQQNFYTDPFWTVQRAMIVSLFMFVAGLGQAVALRQGPDWRRFLRRWVQIAACAVLVSIGSAVMFPNSFITFGVLHGFAVMLIVVRLSHSAGAWLWWAGLLAIGLPQLIQHPWFDTRWTNWVGLVTHKPVTEDFAPVLPWLGVMWWGLASGRWVLARRPQWLAGSLPIALNGLALLGRWSLSFYMVHQPLLIGALLLVMWLR